MIQGDIRCISVARLKALLADPANRVKDTDLICVNRVGNLSFLVFDRGLLKDARMWIDLVSESCEWEGKGA